MTMILSQISFILSILFLSTNHPLSLGFILMVTSIMFSILIFLSSNSAWMSYILMMVFLSGSMIIFIYMTSISSNESVQFEMKFIIICLFLNSSFYMMINKNIFVSNNLKNLNPLKNYLSSNSMEMIYKTYSNSLNFLTLFIIVYLLMVMIVAVKISISTKSPLRT